MWSAVTTCICCVGCDAGLGLLERARLARELHDGAVQSLMGGKMQVDVPAELLQEVVNALRNWIEFRHCFGKVLKLRELMRK